MSVDRRYALLRHDHGLGSPDAFNISSPADGELLHYNSTSAKWENFDLYSATNTWDAVQTFSANPQISNAQPALYFYESDTTDKNWRITDAAGILYFQTVSDAGASLDSKLALADDGCRVDVASHGLDSDQLLRTTGSGVPGSGTGVEIGYNSGSAFGYIQVYDRTGSAYKDLTLYAKDLTLYPSGGSIYAQTGLRVLSGLGSPTGPGALELVYSGGYAYCTGYDRDGSTWKPIIVRGSYAALRYAPNSTDLAVDAAYYAKLVAPNYTCPVITGGILVTANAAKTLALADMQTILYHTTGTHTWTIPPNSSVAFPVGTRIRCMNYGGTVTIARGTGVALYANGGGAVRGNANKTLAVGYNCELVKYGTDLWFAVHDGGVT